MQKKHSQDWLNSAVDPDLTRLSVISLEGSAPYNHLFISSDIPRTNTGKVVQRFLRRYRNIEKGGWWCSGLDPLNDWQPMEWGCFKPDCPRIDKETGKLIKYEHPPKTPTRLFCLRVPIHIWQRVANRHGIPMPENIVVTDSGEALGFWAWVVAHPEIPIIICEGAKKAGAVLTVGFAALAIPGVNGGYRKILDERGNTIGHKLIPDLKPFTQSGREFHISFDHDTKPSTVKAVESALAQFGTLLAEDGCKVKVHRLPGPEKGVDDFIDAQGAAAFLTVVETADCLDAFLAKIRFRAELTHPRALTINQRYLGELPFPTSGLVGVKSAKGTGKTTALKPLVKLAQGIGRKTLLITHRIQLGRFLCNAVGLDWIEDRTEVSPLLGYGLCFDSLSKLNPEHWKGAILILDEVEQSLWHLLNSGTCKEKRVKILQTFQQLIHTVLSTGGLVIAQDADLSDISLDYLQGIAEIKMEPWVVVNEWKSTGSDVTYYDLPNPTLLIAQLAEDLARGLKCYVATDTRSGRYSSETIDRYLQESLSLLTGQYPKTLVVNSETTSTPGHEAIGFVEDINRRVIDYDAVTGTPSVGTGVSIDVRHFDRVYGIFKGVVPDHEARQALARVREAVPRLVWCARRGVGMVGSGSSDYRVLGNWYVQTQTETLALLRSSYKLDLDVSQSFDPIHLRTWAKFGARVNASISQYRHAMLHGLTAEGHKVTVINDDSMSDLDEDKAEVVKTRIKEIRDELQQAKAEVVASAVDIDKREFERLSDKRQKTESERNQERKFILKQRYGVEVTPALKLRDDKGYYSNLKLHYYLVHNPDYALLRDKQEWDKHLERGEGKVFLPDLKTYTQKVEALRALGIDRLLDPQREFENTDKDLVELGEKAFQHRKHIKRLLNISVATKDGKPLEPMVVLSRLLERMYIGLKLAHRKGGRGEKRSRVYQIDPAFLEDGRNQIFDCWRARDIDAYDAVSTTQPCPLVSNTYSSTTGHEVVDTTQHQPCPLVSNTYSSTTGHKVVDTAPNTTPAPIEEGRSHIAQGAMVAYQKFGRMFQFRLERLVDSTRAVIASVLTGELATVPASQLSPWFGSTAG